jgi:lysophospholipase L1-like esterase
MPRKTIAAIACAAAVLGAEPAAHATEEYVALGDSFSSGLGAGEPYHERCGRSDGAFARIIGRERPGTRAVLVACAGAETADVHRDQLDALAATTRWVSVTIGGNDAGFSRVVAECAKPAWAADCGRHVSDAKRFMREALPARLEALLAAIRRRAPQATVVVLSYPRLFRGEDCDPETFFTPREMERMNSAADLLRAKLRSAARSAKPGFRYRDAIPAFERHPLCSPRPWLNGLTRPLRESYHPNRAGHRAGYLPLVRAVMD